MTRERFAYLVEQFFRHRRRREGREGHYSDVARFLGVSPRTVRRWLGSEGRPIPRMAAVIMEILHAYPEITAARVDELLAAGERGE